MGVMTIDGRKVEFTDEPNILTVIRKADIDIPTLCYHSELSVYGACRLCTVENDKGKTFASCSEPPRDGMVIYTNTPRKALRTGWVLWMSDLKIRKNYSRSMTVRRRS